MTGYSAPDFLVNVCEQLIVDLRLRTSFPAGCERASYSCTLFLWLTLLSVPQSFTSSLWNTSTCCLFPWTPCGALSLSCQSRSHVLCPSCRRVSLSKKVPKVTRLPRT